MQIIHGPSEPLVFYLFNFGLLHSISLYSSKKKESDLEAAQAQKHAEKVIRARKRMSSQNTLFGPTIGSGLAGPSISRGGAPNDNNTNGKGKSDVFGNTDGGSDHPGIGETGMGIPGESGGIVFGGEGLLDVGLVLSDSDSD